MNAAIGPVKARFKGKLELADIQAPESYTIRFDMQGGAAGFARGDARVRLEALEANSTGMHYLVNASIGGKLAQVGSRLVDAASAAMADRFFGAFAADLANRYPSAASAAVPVRRPGFFATLWTFLRRSSEDGDARTAMVGGFGSPQPRTRRGDRGPARRVAAESGPDAAVVRAAGPRLERLPARGA